MTKKELAEILALYPDGMEVYIESSNYMVPVCGAAVFKCYQSGSIGIAILREETEDDGKACRDTIN